MGLAGGLEVRPGEERTVPGEGEVHAPGVGSRGSGNGKRLKKVRDREDCHARILQRRAWCRVRQGERRAWCRVRQGETGEQEAGARRLQGNAVSWDSERRERQTRRAGGAGSSVC